MDLWYDGSRVVFGYARAKSENPPDGWLDRAQSYRLRREVEPIHLFELRLQDGSVRQLTSGEWSDLDPTYTPGGEHRLCVGALRHLAGKCNVVRQG